MNEPDELDNVITVDFKITQKAADILCEKRAASKRDVADLVQTLLEQKQSSQT